MRRFSSCLCVFVLSMVCTGKVLAQQASPTPDSPTVPTLVNFSGTLTGVNGKPLTGVVGITFYFYKDSAGGAPLWMETQNVQPDKTGRYSVMLGASTSQGLPTDLFASGEARWLGVQPQGQAEQSRVMLLSVPYALKASDAQTLGGLPPSAFMLAAPASGTTLTSNTAASAGTSASTPPPSSAVTGTGVVNYLPLWDTTSDIVSSVIFQSGTGSTAKLGINTTTPSSTLDVKGAATVRGTLSLPSTGAATATGGKNSQALNLTASAFNNSPAAAVNEKFVLQTEPVGNNTSTPSGSLHLLFGSGTATPTETGFKIASNGQITFAPGQTLPAADLTLAGDVTGAASATSVGRLLGTPLSSTAPSSGQALVFSTPAWTPANIVNSISATGGISASIGTGNVSLSIPSGGITNSMLAGSINPAKISGTAATLAGTNTFAANQTVIGQVVAVAPFLNSGGQFFTASPIIGHNTDTTGTLGEQGVLGIVDAPGGNGVTGEATSSAGNGFGVLGETQATNGGVGVFGHALTFTGNSFGVEGVSHSPAGAGGAFLNNATGGDIIRGYNGGDGVTIKTVFVVNNSGSVGVGNASPAVKLDVLGQDASMRMRNSNTGDQNASTGGFMGNTFETLELGMFNKDSSTKYGVLLPGESRGMFGMNESGIVGTLTNDYPNAPVYRNVLDDGSGNASIAGTLTAANLSGGGAGITGLSAGNLSGVVPVANGGTGSNTQNFVDLTSTQAITGAKTFSSSSNPVIQVNQTGTAGSAISASTASTVAFGDAALIGSASSTATGVLGVSNGGNGVQGITNGSTGQNAVTGFAQSATGASIGVSGTAAGANGIGVRAESTTAATTGLPVALFAFAESATGTAGFFQNIASGGKILSGQNASDEVFSVSNNGAVTGAQGLFFSPSTLQSPAVEAFGADGSTINNGGLGITVGGGTGGGAGNLGGDAIHAIAGGGRNSANPGKIFSGFSSSFAEVFDVANDGTLSVTALAAGTHDPLAKFGSSTASDNNALSVYNGTGNTEIFVAGGGGAFVPGAIAGDGGLRVTAGQSILFGDATLERLKIDGAGTVTIPGNLHVTGTVSKGGGSFKIDHPLDPANKYLSHSFVESPDMMDIYNGNSVLDGQGQAWVVLPEWFEALNQDFRYQLTAIGAPGPNLYIAEEIKENRFKIAGGKPDAKVSWQVTGIRHDAYANAHRIPVEQDKLDRERGLYLHPELFGAPEEKSIELAPQSRNNETDRAGGSESRERFHDPGE